MNMPKICTGYLYKITYPNGKIYIGQDRTNSINYWGSCRPELLEMDFDEDERRDMTIRREIIFEFQDWSISDIYAKEIELIIEHNSSHPLIGYNRTPKPKTIKLCRSKESISL